MDLAATREIGRTGVAVTQLGFGGASIGELNARMRASASGSPRRSSIRSSRSSAMASAYKSD